MSYVNIFETKEEDVIYLLNKAPIEELEKVLKVNEPNITKRQLTGFINRIRKNKKNTLKDYLSIQGIKTRITKIISYRIKQQFDIDHFLPKDKCNLISLSINNFIPSCQVCNSRLKLVKDVYSSNMTATELETLFPTSPNYKYSEEMKFSIETQSFVKPTSFVKTIKKCNLLLKPIKYKTLYEKEAQIFRIQDRYRYHIIEPLTYLDKLTIFNDSYFKMLKSTTKLTDYEISILKEAIFESFFRTNNKRIFEKLYMDIEEQNKI
ncbi:hypothetical protein [Treponema sp. C6A8]|uniref:hypothetical protein n=1 Tax=Treponema sp. C6A8 TaxID=1410609 RepID=UPI00048926B5|nr:hypothetical protein [Treponema sp. C6A8]